MIKTKYDKVVQAYYIHDEEQKIVIILTPKQVEALIDCYCNENDRIMM
ncbi:MAG: hypothetical protein V1901_04185 [Patescibacteria group bacterium]